MAEYINKETVMDIFGDAPPWRGYYEPYAFETHQALVRIVKLFREVISDLPAADVEPTNRWIPCSKKLPEEGEDVLLWDSFDKAAFTGHYSECDGWDVDGYAKDQYHFEITYWQPLPKPPKGQWK